MVVMAPDREHATAEERSRRIPDLLARESEARRPQRLTTILPLVASALFSLVFIARTAFTVAGERYFTLFDDAMVSMRYARNLAAGHGLVWNPGESPIEGYTNFLWTIWMAILHLLPIREGLVPLLVMLSGALILVANVGVVGSIATRLARRGSRVVPLAMWSVALYYPLSYWTLRGMEVGLVALLISGAVLLSLRLRDRFQQRDLLALAVLLAAGVLTRTDVLVPASIIAAFVLFSVPVERRVRVALVLGGTLLGILALHTVGRLVYYGYPLPNTYYLKMEGVSLATRLYRGVWWVAQTGLVHLFGPLAFAIGAFVLRRRTIPLGAWLLAGIFLGQCAYSAYVGGDAWEWMLYANRYITPAVPGLLILGALGVAAFLHAPTTARWWVSSLVIFASAPILALGGVGWLRIGELGPWASTPQRFVTLQGVPLPGRIETVGLLLICGLLMASGPLLRWIGTHEGRGRNATTGVLIGLALLIAVNGGAMGYWVANNAIYVDADATMTRCGLALREATAESASIAVVWAGAPSYFSERRTIDLLGKNDHTIATSTPQRVDTLLGSVDGFVPGHNKWDYSYSIGQLRPDVIAQLWQNRDPGIAGYVPVGDGVLAQSGSAQIALERLSGANLSTCRGY